MRIKKIVARKIVNSMALPCVEVEVIGEDKTQGKASIGQGVSTGKYEVNAYSKKGINYTIGYFNNNLIRQIENIQINSFEDLEKIENIFKAHDPTQTLENLGGNIVIATELAILKAKTDGQIWKISTEKNKLPLPLCNCIGGGKHSGVNSPDIQEFLILPKTNDFKEAIFTASEIYNRLEKELKRRDKTFLGRRDLENAWVPNLNNVEILSILNNTIEKISKQYKTEVKVGLDVAASSLWNGRKYQYKKFAKFQQKNTLSREAQIKFIEKLIRNYDLSYVEDPLQEDDFQGFEELNKTSCLICGDDLIATNLARLKKANRKTISAVIIKPNQIGSLIKTKEVVDYAKKEKITPVISHRSLETEDNSIAHLAVAWEIPIIKTGIAGIAIAKLNELIRISENF